MTHPTRTALDAAIVDANRGHRSHEWERVADDLAHTAQEYIDHVEEKRAATLSDMAAEIHVTAVEKGWWDEPRSASEVLINIHGEVSEAWEDWRVGREEMTFAISQPMTQTTRASMTPEVGIAYSTFLNWAQAHSTREEVGPLPDGVMDTLINAGVAEPKGMEVEVADIIIRCLDFLGERGTDIDRVVRTKMAYNRTRPHRHGGKRA